MSDYLLEVLINLWPCFMVLEGMVCWIKGSRGLDGGVNGIEILGTFGFEFSGLYVVS